MEVPWHQWCQFPMHRTVVMGPSNEEKLVTDVYEFCNHDKTLQFWGNRPWFEAYSNELAWCYDTFKLCFDVRGIHLSSIFVGVDFPHGSTSASRIYQWLVAQWVDNHPMLANSECPWKVQARGRSWGPRIWLHYSSIPHWVERRNDKLFRLEGYWTLTLLRPFLFVHKQDQSLCAGRSIKIKLP